MVASISSCRTGFPSIYHSECEILMKSDARAERCSSCARYRKSLMAMTSRKQKDVDKTNPSSHTNFATLHTPERTERIHRLQQDKKRYMLQLERLKQKIASAADRDGLVVDEEMHEDLKAMAAEYTEQVQESTTEESFRMLFWNQQQQAASLKNSKSMRWHPLFIKWCIYLRHLSGSAYDMLRQSGCIKLPSQKTLCDYTYFTSATIGFSDTVDEQLMSIADTSEERYRYVGMVLDEVHIKADLVYDKHEGALIGFVNLGEVDFMCFP